MGNQLKTQRLGKFYLVFGRSAIEPIVQPEERLATGHGGLSGTVLQNISPRSGGLRQRVHKEVR